MDSGILFIRTSNLPVLSHRHVAVAVFFVPRVVTHCAMGLEKKFFFSLMKRNNAIQNNHFKKTALRIKTWFNQPGRNKRRTAARKEKAAACYPLPTEKLRPIVRCPTIRHNRKARLGRGFTAEECAAAGVDYNYARTVGVAVDLRRKNNNSEAFEANVERLKEYLGKVTIYNSFKEAKQAGVEQHTGVVVPIQRAIPTVVSIGASEVSSFN